jgi:hypothetical protein
MRRLRREDPDGRELRPLEEPGSDDLLLRGLLLHLAGRRLASEEQAEERLSAPGPSDP